MSGRGWPPGDAEQYRQEVRDRLGADLVDRFARVEVLVLDADGVLCF